MNYDSEIRSLAGETIALQRLILALCKHLILAHPPFDQAIRAAFDEAADFLEQQTLARPEVPAAHLGHSLRVIEELRAGLGEEGPKHGV